MRVALDPCDHKGTAEGPTHYSGECDTPYCGSWLEWRCLACGWWVSECLCHSNSGESKISSRQWKTIQHAKRLNRAVADALDKEE
jgi:hypothetical protein